MLALVLAFGVPAFPMIVAFAFAIARDGSPFRRAFWEA